MEHQHHSRGQWGSNLGFLLATVGAAVGLGNIWAFPYKMGANGGFAFLILYLILAILVGFPIMISELAMGRKVGRSVVVTYQSMSKRFGWIGWLAMLSPFLILSFYSVLGAYCMEYVALNVRELLGLAELPLASGADSFSAMLTDPASSVLYTLLFLLICFLIIRGGIKDGIERFNTVGMPALFIMLLAVIVRAVTLPGAAEGLAFMFRPNLQPLRDNFIKVLAAAGGQMFFSLSLAMGITVTYGSYLNRKESLVRNSLLIILSDTLVAVMAGIAVLPAAFALGGEGANMAGPKLLFITLQDVFHSMGASGPLFGILFYLLVLIAAVTSAIALIEVLVTFFVDRAEMEHRKPNRPRLVGIVCLAILAEAVVVALDGLGSNGLWIPFASTGRPFASSWLDFMGCISEGLAMPLGALLMSVMVAWVVKPSAIRDEVTREGNSFQSYRFFSFCIRFVVPVIMVLVLLGQLNEFFGLGLFSA
ncbi:MAG: sodium-dependent transporter [Lawsonibacter sp.]|nr:sodium-dependent transporter [Lawsonibacter sp.]